MTVMNFLQDADGKHPQRSLEELGDHHLLIVGQTGSGKTTTTLAFLHNLLAAKRAAIVLDPTGEYRNLPHSQHYVVGQNCYLDAGRWEAQQLLTVLQLDHHDDQVELLKRAIQSLRIQLNLFHQQKVYCQKGKRVAELVTEIKRLGPWSRSYPLELLPDQLIEEMVIPFADQRADYRLVGQQYDRQLIQQQWQFIMSLRQLLASPSFERLFDFSTHPGTISYELGFVLKMYLSRQSAKTLVIDLSQLGASGAVQRLLISSIFNEMLTIRQQSKVAPFPVDIVLDEAHRYLPVGRQILADNGIFRLLREGRKEGLSLTLTTQSTLDLPDRLRSQFANLLVHHLASTDELAFLDFQELPTTSLATGEVFLIEGGKTASHWRVQAPSVK